MSKERAATPEEKLPSELAVEESEKSLLEILEGFQFVWGGDEHVFKGGNDRFGVSVYLADSLQPFAKHDGYIEHFGINRSARQGKITSAFISGKTNMAEGWHARLQFSDPQLPEDPVARPIQGRRAVLDQWIILDDEALSGLKKASGIPKEAIQTAHLVFGRRQELRPQHLGMLSGVTDLFRSAAEIHHASRQSNFALQSLRSLIRTMRGERIGIKVPKSNRV